MKKFVIKSLGCKTNQIEGQIIAEELISKGFMETKELSGADIFILNSCSVTSHSDSQSQYLINQAKRNNPDIKIIFTGCSAQTIDKHKNFDVKNVDLILGNNEKLDIKSHISDLFDTNTQKKHVKDIFKIKEFNNKNVLDPYQTRPSIKIQEGCNNRCAYCIIPYARGNSRSNSVENIISQIELLSKAGRKEVVLTGIHIGQWGLEFGSNLCALIQEIETSSIERYRLGSLYINEIDDGMIEFLKSSKKFCPHFHLSLQSMCDKTLKNMGRNYTVREAVDVIDKLYLSFEEPFLGCDIIAGFPDESDKDFEITYNTLKTLPMSAIHAFPYSKREGTPAASMKNQIREGIKKERTARLMELSEIKHKEFLERNKDRELEILYERKSLKTGSYSAVTRNFIKVYIKDDRDDLRNTLEVVKIGQFY